MKKLITIAAAVAMWSCALAQGGMVTLAKGEEGKNMEAEALANSWYLGRYDDKDCWLMRMEKGPESFVRKDNWQVVVLDRHLQIYNQVELPMTGDCQVLTLLTNGSYAEILLVDSSKATKTVVMSAEIDMDSMLLVDNKIDTLFSCDLEKDDCCYVWAAASGNGEYIGLLTLQQFTRKRQYAAEAMMYDRRMNELWSKEYPVGTTSCIAVSDEGEMVTLGYDHDGTNEHFAISLIAARTGDNYGLTVTCDPVDHMQILSVMDRKVICAGLFSPVKSDVEKDLTGGTVAMVFDIDSTEITKFTMRPFQNEDFNILQNKKTKKVQHRNEVPMVMPLASVVTPYGVVMAVGHRHVLRYKNANGTVSTSYFAQGIHLMALDDEGTIKWVRNLRRNDFEKDEEDGMYMALFMEGDTLCLLKSESHKSPTDYNIAKEAKEYEVGDKSNLVLYRVTESGDVFKTVLEKKTKHSLIAASKREDGSVLMLTRAGKKTRMVELAF